MAKTLDLRAPAFAIKFDKGKTVNPVFFYLDKNKAAVNLTGYQARMQVRAAIADVEPVLDLTTENAGLAIVTGTAELPDGVTVANAYGVQLNISGTQTAAINWASAVFDIELIEPGGGVLPFIKGVLTPSPEVTR